jgi:hypothetical protein
MTVPTKAAKAAGPQAEPEGLTLRDQFAIQAIAGCLSPGRNFDKESLAVEAYELADAMVAARKKEAK